MEVESPGKGCRWRRSSEVPTKGEDISHRGGRVCVLVSAGSHLGKEQCPCPLSSDSLWLPQGVTAPLQPPGGSSSSADTMMCKPGLVMSKAGLERAYGAGWREVGVLKEATWGGHCLICGEITESMTEHSIAPLHGRFQSVLNLTQVNPKAGVGENCKEVTCW